MGSTNKEEIILKVTNDKSAKRFGKKKFNSKLFTEDFRESFIEKYPEYSHKTLNTIIKDWKIISGGIMDIILNEPDGVKLGKNMGEFKLGLLRVHNVIDTQASAEVGKPVKFMNFHTNRKPGKLVWKTEFARKTNFYLKYLGFETTREIRKKCMESFRSHGHIFKDVSSNNKLLQEK